MFQIACYATKQNMLTLPAILLSPLHTHFQPQRLPQEPLSRIHLQGNGRCKFKQPEDRSKDHSKFHLSHVSTDAGPRPRAERDESRLLTTCQSFWSPAFWNKGFCIGAPDLARAVDGVCWYGQDVTGVKCVAADGNRGLAGWDLARESER